MKILISTFLILLLSAGTSFAGKKQLTNVNDVTNGATIAGVTFDKNTKAGATISYYAIDNTFELLVDFIALRETPQGYFYEGWLVDTDTSDFFSTGEVSINASRGIYQDAFLVNEDLRAYDFYVLTLEPDDNDPAPADHILEGKAKVRSFSQAPNKNSKSKANFKKSQGVFTQGNTKETTKTSKEKVETTTVNRAQQDLLENRINSLSQGQKSGLKLALPRLEERYKNNARITEIIEFIKHILG